LATSRFNILGPDYNIDYYYMGDDGAAILKTFSEAAAGVLGSGQAPAGVQPGKCHRRRGHGKTCRSL